MRRLDRHFHAKERGGGIFLSSPKLLTHSFHYVIASCGLECDGGEGGGGAEGDKVEKLIKVL